MSPRKYSFVYPNTTELNRKSRGSLEARWKAALKNSCELVDLPADFIKNKIEVNLTRQDFGSFLDEESISVLYNNEAVSMDVRFILHSELSLLRRDVYGLPHQSPLQWHNQKWVERLTSMLISISRFFNRSPDFVEINPGGNNAEIHLI